jgi:hypothetical protein
MFCTQCGQRVAEGAGFCNHCGAAMAAPAAAPAAAPVPPPPAPSPAPIPTAAPSRSADPVPPPRPPAPPAPPPPPRPAASPPPSAGAVPAFDANALARGLVARVKAILLSPSTEWPVIAGEATTAQEIFTKYVAPLALIGVLATFIGHSLIGVSVPILGTFRVPIIGGIIGGIVSFAMTFLVVWVVSLIVNALAPTFDGQKDPLAALKVTAYAYTPAWIAGVLNILPFLGMLGILAGLYGLYLLYTGLPVLMRCPKDKSIGYTALVVVCAIVLGLVIGAVSAGVIGTLGFAGIAANSAMSSRAADRNGADAAAGVLSGIFGGKSDAEKAKVGDALKTLERLGEQADKSGKPAAATSPADLNAALGAVGAIVAGGKDVQPVDFRKLRELLPETLPGMTRGELSGQSGEAMGLKGSSAVARYSGGDANISIEIADMGSLSGLAGLAKRFDPNMEKETDTGYERTRRVNDQLVHERYDRRGRSGELMVMAGDRFTVTVEGSGVEPDALAGALKQVDFGRLAALAATAK